MKSEGSDADNEDETIFGLDTETKMKAMGKRS
jgi:hypothetical protein